MIFNNTKTKWKPIHFYNPVANTNRVLLFARYDRKTGLYDFKSVKLGVDMYDSNSLSLKYDAQKVLNELLEE